MVEKDKIVSLSEQLNKKDLDTILEVNRKAVEIETEVASQNEEIIGALNSSKAKQDAMDSKIDKIISQNEEISRDIFVMKVLYIGGILALVGQIIQLFVKH